MTNAFLDNSSSASLASDNGALEYRSIYTGAILALLLGILSAPILFVAGNSIQSTLMMAPIPIAGIIISLNALRAISAAKDVYTGENFASAGLLLSLLFLISGIGYSSFIYATEVPDGYFRTSFLDLKPSEAELVNRDFVPDDIKKLIGKTVFIKGYIRPGSITYHKNIDNFLLVRDYAECCFGDASKVKFFDQIKVQLVTGKTTDYHTGLFRVGGTLGIGPGNPESGTPFTYEIKGDYVRD